MADADSSRYEGDNGTVLCLCGSRPDGLMSGERGKMCSGLLRDAYPVGPCCCGGADVEAVALVEGVALLPSYSN
jgi:hypothetical protein